ncbi:FxLYD domain-containing protein [Halovivax sp.]|uniref:FxLYD domain-containing protein n=1 Tax=Halovivax sp. TaxID=1935978 RepID=UPI0025C60F4D|nr:FxLYD domain-containing protein [Halovivax sp.]
MRSSEAGRDRDRRRFLAAAGAVLGASLAGCVDGREPDYEPGDVPDVDGEPRTAEEMAAAEAIAERDVREGVSPLDDLAVSDHEFVLEDGYEGATVRGTVSNDGDDRIELVEVRVRVYDENGDQLGRYLDRTGDLGAGERWAFAVVLLEAPDDIAEYDVAVLGTPT